MKLRVKDNSLRIRLSADEVGRLLSGKKVEAATRFAAGPSQCLVYGVECWPDVPAMTSVYKPGHIRILIPEDQLRHWGASDATSLRASQPIGDGQSLQLLVEKDMPCKDGSGG